LRRGDPHEEKRAAIEGGEDHEAQQVARAQAVAPSSAAATRPAGVVSMTTVSLR
jgi:hypothetical protein